MFKFKLVDFFKHKDVRFLDSDECVKKVNQLIRRIVYYRLIKPGWENPDQLDELVQDIAGRFLIKLPEIRNNYRRKANLLTYLTVIISNFCNQILRERKKNILTRALPVDQILESKQISSNEDLRLGNDGEITLLLDDVLDRLRITLRMYGDHYSRIMLFLQLFYGFPVSLDAIKSYCPKLRNELLLARIKENSCGEKSNSERYHLLNDMVNYCEGKENKPDSIRKEMEKYLNEIVDNINGYPPLYAFNKETLKYLFEKYRDKYSNNASENDL